MTAASAAGPDIRIDVHAAADLAKAFAQAPEVVIEEFSRAMTEATLLLEREVKEETPVGIGGGGGLKGSIAARTPQALADNVIGLVGTPLSYAVPVEFGTRPHMPPVQPLADWAEYKLGVAPDQARSIGWRIARKIAAQGTEGAHMFGRAVADNEGQVQAIFARARERIAERIAGGDA